MLDAISGTFQGHRGTGFGPCQCIQAWASRLRHVVAIAPMLSYAKPLQTQQAAASTHLAAPAQWRAPQRRPESRPSGRSCGMAAVHVLCALRPVHKPPPWSTTSPGCMHTVSTADPGTHSFEMLAPIHCTCKVSVPTSAVPGIVSWQAVKRRRQTVSAIQSTYNDHEVARVGLIAGLPSQT